MSEEKQTMIRVLSESELGQPLVPVLERFMHLSDDDFINVAKALCEVQTLTMERAYERMKEVVGQ